VIDLDAADRIGRIDELIVDPYAPCIAGYIVAGRPALTGRRRFVLPVEAVEAVGPDAITIRMADRSLTSTPHLDALPRFSELTGRKMVSFGGRLLGSVQDALIDERNGRIVGYPLEQSRPAEWIESLFGFGGRRESLEFVRADAALRVGARLIVVPDDAIAGADEMQHADADQPSLATSTRYGDGAHDVLTASEGRATDAASTGVGTMIPTSYIASREANDLGRREPEPEDPWSDVDHDGDTGLLSDMAGRGRGSRRPQAVKMR
jgi:uncharacterized protein YrrD